VSPDGTTAYVTNLGTNNVSVINTATNMVTATIAAGTEPIGVAVSPDGTTAYVTNLGTNNVSVINTATNMVTATIPVGMGPDGVAVSPDGTTAYVTNTGSGNVSVIDTANNMVTDTITAGMDPTAIAIFTTTPTPPPSPSNLNVVKKRNDVIWEYELYNILTWNASTVPAASYIVFANGNQIATVTAVPNQSSYEVVVNNVPKGQTTYSVVAVDTMGNQSSLISTTVNNK
jgi:YVTN family beta-propeller protein